jgi:hypothetical protein
VDHQDHRQLLVVCRPREVALDAAVALRRRHGGGLRLDPLVVSRHLDRPGIVGLQHLKERGCGHPADGEFLGAVQERATADRAVYIAVEEVQQLLREIGCFFAVDRRLVFHNCASLMWPGSYREVEPAVDRNPPKSSGCVSNVRLPSGSAIQGCLPRVQKCIVGRSQDGSSKVPARTRTADPGCGAPLIHEPHSGQTQRVTTFPLSAVFWSGRGAPLVRWKASPGTTIAIEKALLVRRWQSVQWQA